MLQECKLYSFIDQNNGFTLHFLEGQKLINDLAIIHECSGPGFQFYRDAVLTFMNMISYLKPAEALGVYIESEEPYFRLNIELNEQGQMRTLILPEDFKIFPKLITGRCRIVKLATGKNPYTSIIDLEQNTSDEVVNKILNESYQFKSRVFLSDVSDQSVMIMKLPNKNVDRVIPENETTITEYFLQHKAVINKLFEDAEVEYSKIQQAIETKDLIFLGSKDIRFKCTCERDRMFRGVQSIIFSEGINAVFAPDEDVIETKCDYCKQVYAFHRNDFLS